MPKLVPRVARWVAAFGLLGGCACAGGDASARGREVTASPLDAVRGLPAPPRREAPRLSLAQPYRTCVVDDAAPLGAASGCGAPAAAPVTPPGLSAVVAAASARTRAQVDADALHALALADLAWSDTAGNALDRSISTLRTVARLSARPAPVLADLAAALLMRAERRREARDLFEAADVALLALESDSALAPAHFNLALALGRIGLVDETAKAWAAFLAVEPRGPWADEARRRTAAVAAVEPPRFDPRAADLAAEAARAPQEARLYGWNEALGRWGAAMLAGDTAGAGRELAWARTAGEALEARGGDATLADAVRVIEAAVPNAQRTRALAAAHRAFAAGSAHYSAIRYAEAEAEFATATNAPGPLGMWARAFDGATQAYRGRRTSAVRTFREVLTGADARRHPALTGRVQWMLGTTLQRDGHTEAALRQHRAAAGAFARSREREHFGAVQAVAAHTVYMLGDSRTTARVVRDALVTLSAYRGSSWRYNALYAAALAAAREGFARVALRAQDEAVAVAARGGRPTFLAEAQATRARLAVAGGAVRYARARADLAAARRTVAALPAGSVRDWVRADLQVTRTALFPPAAGTQAADLDSAVAYFMQPRTPERLIPALLARADLHLRGRNTAKAAADLDAALSLLTAEQGRTDSLAVRESLRAAARDVVYRAVALDVARGEHVEALARLERSRSANVAAQSWSEGPHPQKRPVRGLAGAVVVSYALVDDTLLIWTVADTVVRLSRVVVPRERLLGTAERARAGLELRAGEASGVEELARLYDWLVRPLGRRVGPPGTPLVVVADGGLDAVPFAALWDRERRRFLVEDHGVQFALSAGATPRTADAGAGSASALVVADPTLGAAAPPGLRPLRGARAEASEVAAAYRNSRTVLGADASVRRVLAMLEGVPVVHFAGHAVFDDERPARSRLLLAPAVGNAPEDEAAGVLSADRLASLDLRRTRLVVLSACETARAPSGRVGGFAGLAGAFLAAGAGGVVGTAWRVDDEAARALMGGFHRAYARTGDAPRALRDAQLALLQSHDPALRTPAAWAGFRYIGR